MKLVLFNNRKKRKMFLANLWMMKYFSIELVIEKFIFFIVGINIIIFNSMQTQIKNKELLDRAIIIEKKYTIKMLILRIDLLIKQGF